MHKYLLSAFVIFIILCFTVNGATAKTYNTLLINSTNSKLRLITYDDSIDNSCKNHINFSNDIVYIDCKSQLNLIKFKNNYIKNAVAIQTKDTPRSVGHIKFEQPYMKESNIFIPFIKNSSVDYWNGYYGYVFLTSEPIKISIDLNKIDTPIAVTANKHGYFYPFSQNQDRYLLYTDSLENLFK